MATSPSGRHPTQHTCISIEKSVYSNTVTRMIIHPSQCTSEVVLPQELVDEIIDYISDDIATLFACHLTCRIWEISAKRYLFGELAINRSSGEVFTRLTQGKSKTPQSIKILTISQDKPESTLADDEWPNTPIFIKTVASRFRQCSKLGFLQFWSSESFTESLNIMAWNNILRDFTSVRRLCIQFICFEFQDELVDLLIALPTVTELELWQVSGLQLKLAASPSLPTISSRLLKQGIRKTISILCPNLKKRLITDKLPVIALRQLECASAFSATEIFTRLMTKRASFKIDTLILYCLRREDGQSISCILQNIGSSLKHLEMRLVATIQGVIEAIVRPIEMTFNMALHTLTLHYTPTLSGISSIPDILSRVVSPNIHLISLKLHGEPEVDDIADPLEQIDNILSSHKFKHLHNVAFEFYGRNHITEITKAIQAGMPLLASRGIMTFELA